MYCLPHPLQVLQSPPSKETYKTLVKAKVTDYWECKFRDEAKSLSSLFYFKPGHMSLKYPHPMFTTATTPYESCKAVVQARMVSGRYRTEELCRHWSSNEAGLCLATSCREQEAVETIDHILRTCMALSTTRSRLLTYSQYYTMQHPGLSNIMTTYCTPSSPHFTQFLVDCSSLPLVVTTKQQQGPWVLD